MKTFKSLIFLIFFFPGHDNVLFSMEYLNCQITEELENNKSAKKRILIAKRNRLQNRFYITSVRTLTKLFLKNLEIYKESKTAEDKAKVQNILNSLYSLIDKGLKKKVFHKNTAARKKSKLALQFKAI